MQSSFIAKGTHFRSITEVEHLHIYTFVMLVSTPDYLPYCRGITLSNQLKLSNTLDLFSYPDHKDVVLSIAASWLHLCSSFVSILLLAQYIDQGTDSTNISPFSTRWLAQGSDLLLKLIYLSHSSPILLSISTLFHILFHLSAGVLPICLNTDPSNGRDMPDQ